MIYSNLESDIPNETYKGARRPKSSCAEILQAIASLIAVVCSIVALLSVSTVLQRDDATGILLQGEKAFKAGDYESSYARFSSALLYDNAIAKVYLGYMNSNGLGCEKNILLGTGQYQKAIALGYDGCENNLIFNIVNYSTCYYEIAETLLAAYENGNPSVTLFLADTISDTGSASVSGFRGDSAFTSTYDLYGARNQVDAYLAESENNIASLIEALQATISTDNEMTNEIKMNYPLSPWGVPCSHDICSPDAEHRLYCGSNFKRYTDSNGNILMYGTIQRYKFRYDECIQQVIPTVMQ